MVPETHPPKFLCYCVGTAVGSSSLLASFSKWWRQEVPNSQTEFHCDVYVLDYTSSMGVDDTRTNDDSKYQESRYKWAFSNSAKSCVRDVRSHWLWSDYCITFNLADIDRSFFFVFDFFVISSFSCLSGNELTLRDYAGYSLFALGFLIEAIADQQKRNFRALPQNEGKFITTGLWSWSRHPNYLGEIMLWTGLFLPASSCMSGWEYLSAASPLFITYLLTRVSGVPMLERYADKKWGGQPVYEKYKASTACLVPYIW